MQGIDRRTLITGAGVGMVVTPVNAAADTKLRATALRAASACNPLGIGDAQPMLSWRIAGPAGTMQTAYQIRAASDRAQLGTGRSYLWNSGRISEATSTGVRYGGGPLASCQRIHWQVRIWDAAGRVSPWSEPASFETGLLAADDWRGDWLAVESALERDDRLVEPRWLRVDLSEQEGRARFRLTFSSPAGEGLLTIDTRSRLLSLSIDGQKLAVPDWHPDAYGGPPAARLPLALTAGDHVLFAEVAPRKDHGRASATIAAQLRLPRMGGAARRIVDGWECAARDGQWQPALADERQEHFRWPPSPARLLRRRFMLTAKPREMRLHVAAEGGATPPSPSGLIRRTPSRRIGPAKIESDRLLQTQGILASSTWTNPR